jgi:hypothetical protein
MNLDRVAIQPTRMVRRKQMPPLWLMVIAGLLLFWIWRQNNPEPLDPSRDELLAHGFYVFVLPQEVREPYNWSERFHLYSWDKHCHFVDSAESYNPLTLNYRTPTNDAFFTVSIDPWESSWSDGETQTIAVHKPWIHENTVTRFLSPVGSETQTKLRFEDYEGTPIYIISSLPITESLTLVESLELIGSDGVTPSKAWNCS